MLKFIFLTILVTHTLGLGQPYGKVILPKNYSKYYRPVLDRSTIMNISVGLVITQILEIDFEQSSLAFDVEFIMKWKDELIDIEGGIEEQVEIQNASEIWTPDLYIYKLKTFEIKKTSQLATHLALKRNGSVVDVNYLFEAKVVIICDAQFADFPFHKHDCYLQLSSFTKTINQVVFTPDHDYPTASLVELKSFDYRIQTSYLAGEATVRQGIKNPSVLYSIVGIKLELFSKWQKYITLYYVPTVLIVLTSWIFFLLPSTSYPARTALLVTVFLLLINIFSSVVNETPNTSDGEMTALELWTLACIFTVFGSLLSYGFILSRDQMIIQGVLNAEGEAVEEKKKKAAWEDATSTHLTMKDKTKKNVAFETALFTMVFAGFACFNIYYWATPRAVFQ